MRIVSSSSSSSSRKPTRMGRRQFNCEKFLSRVISPAIRGQACPICFKHLDDSNNNRRRTAVIRVCLHAYCVDCISKWSDLKRKCPLCNAEFDSWYYNISFSSRSFLTKNLPPFNEGKSVISNSQQIIRRSRDEFNVGGGRRSRQLPWRRTFGRPGDVPPLVIAERKLQWRASVYKRSLRAVPLSPRDCVEQSVYGNGWVKETMLRRIEPWIRRELQATLEDPDPSVIVHVASSLYISRVEKKLHVCSRQLDFEDEFLAPLQRFLHNWTDMFWHELRCFAESCLTMETYDAVVEYMQSD